jgi:hypothetical protein
MEIAMFLCLLIFGGLVVMLGAYVSRELRKKLDVETFRSETLTMGEKELAGFRKACSEIQLEWESVYTKFVRLYQRSVKQSMEDNGTAKGGPNSRAANASGPPPSSGLTREDIKRMIAQGVSPAKVVRRENEAWPTGSAQAEQQSSVE